MNRRKLFCIPYAGGSAMIYRRWVPYLSNTIELVPVELKGRGQRINEGFYASFEEIVDEVARFINKEASDTEYAVFGHSMGCVLAYEVACELIRKGYKEPIHMFYSGRMPPSAEADSKIFHILDDDSFIDEIVKYGGAPKEVWENQELRDLFLPILREDYRLMETRKIRESCERVSCNITVLNGIKDEDICVEKLSDWNNFTKGSMKLALFQGDHFYINTEIPELLKLINAAIGSPIKSVS